MIVSVSAALAFGLYDVFWRNRSLTRLLPVVTGTALGCILLFDHWLAGLIIGAMTGPFILPVYYFQGVGVLPSGVVAPALGLGFLAAIIVYIALRALAAEALGITVSIMVFSGLSISLADRWNYQAISNEANRMGLDVIYIRSLNGISQIGGGPPHACAVVDDQAFGWSYSDYGWYPAPHTWRCANPRHRLDYANW